MTDSGPDELSALSLGCWRVISLMSPRSSRQASRAEQRGEPVAAATGLTGEIVAQVQTEI